MADEIDSTPKVIKSYRASCQFYLKINLALLAGVTTIAIILNLARSGFFGAIFSEKEVILTAMIIFCFGLIYDPLVISAMV